METSVQETDVQKMDEGSKSEVEQLLSGCIVTPLLKEMQKANQCLGQGEQKGRENLLKDIKTQHGSTKGELTQISETVSGHQGDSGGRIPVNEGVATIRICSAG